MTRISIPIEIRFLRIPAEWTCDHRNHGRDFGSQLLPTVLKSKPQSLDGWAIRNCLLRLPHTEAAAIKFLNEVGVWWAEESYPDPRSPLFRQERRIDDAYGGRYFAGKALPVFTEQLWSIKAHWLHVLKHPSAWRDQFRNEPARRGQEGLKARINRDQNQLPLRIEWDKGRPIGVIETITGEELLTATAQLDFLRQARFAICQRPDCAIPFSIMSEHPRKYCEWNCGHLESIRRQRRKAKQLAKGGVSGTKKRK